jgi:hypothetical protein
LKKIIYTTLIWHLNHNNISVDEQFGFRTKSSIDLASYKIINDVLTSLNDKLLVGGVSRDSQKAFDVLIMSYYCQNWIGMESQVKNINYFPHN